jgi:hypothetical protein
MDNPLDWLPGNRERADRKFCSGCTPVGKPQSTMI